MINMIVSNIGLGVLLIVGLSAVCRAGVMQDQDILDILDSSSKDCTELLQPEATEIDKNDNILEEPVKDESLDVLESEERVQPRRKRSKSESSESSETKETKESSESRETREKKEEKESKESSETKETSESSESRETREKKEREEKNKQKDQESDTIMNNYIARIGRSIQ